MINPPDIRTLTVANWAVGNLIISVVQEYQIIDPELPYNERFRVLAYRMEIEDEESTWSDVRLITLDDAVSLTKEFAGLVSRMHREPVG